MLFPIILGLLLVVGTCLHWALGYPCALSFHEQNQMFLYSVPYLQERLSQPGGFCAWLAEWLTQYYYYPLAGAVIIALLLLGIYVGTLRYLRGVHPVVAALLSALLPCSLLCVMGNEQVMLCYVVALLVVLSAAVVCRRCRHTVVLIPVQALLYYAAGPLAYVFAILASRSLRRFLLLAATLLGCLLLAYGLLTPRYPWPVLLHGLYYFRAVRFDLDAPAVLLLLPLLLPALAFGGRYLRLRLARPILTAGIGLVLLSGAMWAGIRCCYDADKYAQLRQDYLIRRGQWPTLLSEARQHQPHTAMSSTAVNLALAMTDQLADHCRGYHQCGMEGLICSQQRDNIQTLPTMEAFYRLGLINLALWYAFEAQQAMPDQNASARLTQRLAECNLILGRYEVAGKYIDLLRQTQFYSHWATQAEQLLGNDALLERHMEYGRLRRLMPPACDDCVCPHPQMDVILGRLYARNHSNRLALQYYLAAQQLMGNAGPQPFIDNGPY